MGESILSVNKHGLKMTGLRATVSAIKSISSYGFSRGLRMHVFYDYYHGEVLCSCIMDPHNDRRVTYQGTVVFVRSYCRPVTMQRLADDIFDVYIDYEPSEGH